MKRKAEDAAEKTATKEKKVMTLRELADNIHKSRVEARKGPFLKKEFETLVADVLKTIPQLQEEFEENGLRMEGPLCIYEKEGSTPYGMTKYKCTQDYFRFVHSQLVEEKIDDIVYSIITVGVINWKIEVYLVIQGESIPSLPYSESKCRIGPTLPREQKEETEEEVEVDPTENSLFNGY